MPLSFRYSNRLLHSLFHHGVLFSTAATVKSLALKMEVIHWCPCVGTLGIESASKSCLHPCSSPINWTWGTWQVSLWYNSATAAHMSDTSDVQHQQHTAALQTTSHLSYQICRCMPKWTDWNFYWVSRFDIRTGLMKKSLVTSLALSCMPENPNSNTTDYHRTARRMQTKQETCYSRCTDENWTDRNLDGQNLDSAQRRLHTKKSHWV